MMKIILPAAVLSMLGAGAAFAEEGCSVPQSEWQTQEALQQKLEAEGWTVRSIEVEDGCFEAYAISPDGARMEVEFNPATLAMIHDESESDDDD